MTQATLIGGADRTGKSQGNGKDIPLHVLCGLWLPRRSVFLVHVIGDEGNIREGGGEDFFVGFLFARRDPVHP